MPSPRHPARRLFILLGLLVSAFALPSLAQTISEAEPAADNDAAQDHIVSLEAFQVSAHNEDDDRYDPTGMGGTTAEMDEPPFSNDLLAGGSGPEEEFDIEINTELQLAVTSSPADLATAVNRINLRGFPTPRLRNGFSQTGIPETLNVNNTELIQGPITPVTGRAAPGGIRNYITARPTGRTRTQLSLSASSHSQRDARVEYTSPLIPKKLWQRIAAGWRETTGPVGYAYSRNRYASGAITLRHSRSASTMISFDYADLDSNPSPGVPDYRETTGGKIIGPYLPLINFNSYGPNASVEKRIATAAIQFEAQLARRLSLRANLLGWWRSLYEDRFTTGQYILDTGKFGGTREPRRVEQPLTAFVASAEATARLAIGKTDHKVTLLVEQTHTAYTRRDRALSTADRNALPADVRTFDPYAPNYYRPAYSDALYGNLRTDRREDTAYTSIALSERAAFWRGKLVATAGVRSDFVTLDLEDRRPTAPRSQVNDRTRELTWHLGANYLLLPSRLLLFANTSRAFEPSTRVDARTGRIQGNETTLGYEAGFKGFFLKRRLAATALFFQYTNQNISRRNPRYDDPIYDPNQLEPQLLSAGEERFTGGSLDLKASPGPGLTFAGRLTYTDPITTKSPDVPEEVGRPLSRMPRTTAGFTTRYQFQQGPLRSLSMSGTLTYISGYTAYYENDTRAYLAYPSNTLVSLSLSRSWRFGPPKSQITHTVSLGVRNLFDRDLVAAFARPGQGREFNASYRLVF